MDVGVGSLVWSNCMKYITDDVSRSNTARQSGCCQCLMSCMELMITDFHRYSSMGYGGSTTLWMWLTLMRAHKERRAREHGVGRKLPRCRAGLTLPAFPWILQLLHTHHRWNRLFFCNTLWAKRFVLFPTRTINTRRWNCPRTSGQAPGRIVIIDIHVSQVYVSVDLYNWSSNDRKGWLGTI